MYRLILASCLVAVLLSACGRQPAEFRARRKPLLFVRFVGSFVLIPNVAAYVQANLGFPREWMGGLYMVGGVVSFGVSRLVGVLVDRYGSTVVNGAGVVLFLIVAWWGFYGATTATWVPVVFVLFFIAMGFRNLSVNTQATRVPRKTAS